MRIGGGKSTPLSSQRAAACPAGRATASERASQMGRPVLMMAEASSSTAQDARTQALELIKASALEFERSQKLDLRLRS